jgi:hypothetical protein
LEELSISFSKPLHLDMKNFTKLKSLVVTSPIWSIALPTRDSTFENSNFINIIFNGGIIQNEEGTRAYRKRREV